MSRIIIAGGGTGGHIYPGIAVAKVLTGQGHDVAWVGARGGLEEKIVLREGLPLHLIRVGKLHHTVGRLEQLKTLLGLPFAFLHAVVLAFRLKPDAVLGVGGFASGPFLFASALLRKRTVVWEPNAHAGLANRLLSRLVNLCLIVFDEARKDLRNPNIVRVGLPVRQSIVPRDRPGAAERPFRILVFGGSQGARAINRAITAYVSSPEWSSQFELVHQTGRYDYEETKRVYESLSASGRDINVTCTDYLHDMEARYAWADLVICRAGASTAAEIAASGKAAIFIPLPTAADDHQLKNAKVFEIAGAAAIIEQKNLTVETLSKTVRRFYEEPVLVERLEQAVRKFATPKAAQSIASFLLGTARP